MTTVSIRDLRNHGGEVVDRVAEGEHITVTRDGRPVAELRPIRPAAGSGLPAARLIERWRRLPAVEPQAMRRDIDAAVDPSL